VEKKSNRISLTSPGKTSTERAIRWTRENAGKEFCKRKKILGVRGGRIPRNPFDPTKGRGRRLKKYGATQGGLGGGEAIERRRGWRRKKKNTEERKR